MTDTMPEISVKDLSVKMIAGEKFTILDVREPWELGSARIKDERVINIPMSRIRQALKSAFPPELSEAGAEMVVMCHHGVRSANVTQWMLQNGWKNVKSLTGGIDAYVAEIDPSVGFY